MAAVVGARCHDLDMGTQFTADLWAHRDEPGSWHFVTLPLEVAEEIRDEAGPRPGFGSIRVSVTVGATTWQTSLFPEGEGGSMVLPMKKAVRIAEGLVAGDPCVLTVEIVDP
jgi:hypothetical protein